MPRERSERRKRFAHIAAGGVILVHAWEKFDAGHASALFFAVAGIVFLVIAVLHPTLERRVPWIDGVFFVIEGILSLIVAYEYFHVGKKALPWAYVAVGVAQLVMAIRASKRGIDRHNAAH